MQHRAFQTPAWAMAPVGPTAAGDTSEIVRETAPAWVTFAVLCAVVIPWAAYLLHQERQGKQI